MRIHRTTWVALPILALVIVGTGTGWWGFQQHQQRQALAIHLANSYNAAFHGLTADIEKAHQTIGEALVSTDPQMLSQRLQTLARVSFDANGQAGRLPANTLPNGHIQAFTADLGNFAQHQAVSAHTSAPFEQQLTTYWKQTGQLVSQLHQLSTDIGRTHQVWLYTVQQHNHVKSTAMMSADRSFAAGLRQLDAAAGHWTTQKTPLNPAGSSPKLQATAVAANQARVTSAFAAFTMMSSKSPWRVEYSKGSSGQQVDVVQGTTQEGPIYGSVAPSNALVLSFHVDRPIANNTAFDLVQAKQRAQQWLATRKFPAVQSTGVSQFDNTAYCTFAPLYHGVPIVDQEIVVHVGLDRGDVIGYQGTLYDRHTLATVPDRLFTAKQLRGRVSPKLAVREARTVVALDNQHHPQPAVAFYGTSHGETYCVVMNANSGREIRITQLTNHM